MIANYNHSAVDLQHESVRAICSSGNSQNNISSAASEYAPTSDDQPPAYFAEIPDFIDDQPPAYFADIPDFIDEHHVDLALELLNQESLNIPGLDESSERSNAPASASSGRNTPSQSQEPTASSPATQSEQSNTHSSADNPKAEKAIYSSSLVVQQNALLEKIKDLDLYEYRLFLYLGTTVRWQVNEDPSSRVFEVDIMSLARRFNINRGHHLYSFMRKAAKSLQKKLFDHTSSEDSDKYKDFDKFDELNAGCRNTSKMFISLTPETIKMLTVFDKEHPYTKYEFNDVVGIKNHSTLVLFESIARYRKYRKRYFTIEHMRKMFNCEDKYPKITDFIRYIVKKMAKQITDSTSYQVSVSIKKEGSKTIGATFHFKNVKQELYANQKELAKVDFNYETSEEIVQHNVSRAVKLTPSQLHRIASRKAFVQDHQVAPNSPHNRSGMAYIEHMIMRLSKDPSFVKKHTLDYYLEQSEEAFPSG